MVDYLTQEMINWKELSQQQVLLVPFGMGAYVHFAKNQGDFRGSKNINFSKSPPFELTLFSSKEETF